VNTPENIATFLPLDEVLAQVAQNQKDLPAAIQANQNAGNSEAEQNLAAVEALIGTPSTTAFAAETPDAARGGSGAGAGAVNPAPAATTTAAPAAGGGRGGKNRGKNNNNNADAGAAAGAGAGAGAGTNNGRGKNNARDGLISRTKRRYAVGAWSSFCRRRR